MKKLSAIIALLGLISCGGGSTTTSTFSYSYLYCRNCLNSATNVCYTEQGQCQAGGCTTGQKSFSSKTDACSTLSSATQNNSCASDTRQKNFTDLGCPGTFGG